MKKRMLKISGGLAIACICLLGLTGCVGATGVDGMKSEDATERGLSYVAAAIVSAAVIRAIFND